MTSLNRRFLAMHWNEPTLNFALWRQKIGNLLSQSGKLQPASNEFYLEFPGKDIETNFLVGIDVIGMETALPHEGLDRHDYGAMEWDRVELGSELPVTIDELKPYCSQAIANYAADFNRLRICQVTQWDQDQLRVWNFLDFIK